MSTDPMTLDAEKAGVPVVRGLVWRSVSDSVDEADTPIGEYQVAYYIEVGEGSGWSAVFRDNEEIGEYPTSLTAMSACQADYEQRITSALNPDYVSALDAARAEIERLRRENAGLRGGEATYVAALTAAQERIAELEGALKPFAFEVGMTIFEEDPDDMPVYEHRASANVTIGDFRRARATLSPAVKEPK